MNAVEVPSDAPARPTSQARVEANRLNALRSTGPKTDEGRRRSRANALKHGLTARVVDVESDEARQAARAESLRSTFGASGPWADYACAQAARASVQVERAADMVDTATEAASVLAEDPEHWADARRGEVDRLAERFRKAPARAVSALMECPHGVDWLIARWQSLRVMAEKGEGWDESATWLALDLLRVPRDQRVIAPIGAYLMQHPDEPPPAGPGELARRMIGRLALARDRAEEVDEIRRLSTVAGRSDRFAPDVQKFRRYESGLHRRVQWLVGLLRADQSTAQAQAQSTAPAPARNEPIAAPAAARNEPNAAVPAAPARETNPTVPPSHPEFRPAEPLKIAQPGPVPQPASRHEPSRMLRRDEKRRRRRA